MTIHSRAALIKAIESGESFEYLLFYGHKESPDGSASDSCFSQWFPAAFEIDGTKYPTAEHFMMAEKARLFNDAEMLEKILLCKTPKEAKALGRKVHDFEAEIWQKHCIQIVCKANLAKFSQNPKYAEFLLATAPKILVEASLWDRIWGIGMAKSNPKALNPHDWSGQNLLGFALVQVRDQLHRRSE